MEKDFEAWHKKKVGIHKKPKTVFFHEREIWWCALGANVGNEQDGKGALFTRPVLILKKGSVSTMLVCASNHEICLASSSISNRFGTLPLKNSLRPLFGLSRLPQRRSKATIFIRFLLVWVVAGQPQYCINYGSLTRGD